MFHLLLNVIFKSVPTPIVTAICLFSMDIKAYPVFIYNLYSSLFLYSIWNIVQFKAQMISSHSNQKFIILNLSKQSIFVVTLALEIWTCLNMTDISQNFLFA